MTSTFPPCDDCFRSLSDPQEHFRPFTPSSVDIPTLPVVTILFLACSYSKLPSNLARQPIHPTHRWNLLAIPQLKAQLLVFLDQLDYSSQLLSQKTIILWLHRELPSLNLLLSDIRPFLSRPKHLKFQFDHWTLERQHRREYYIIRARMKKKQFSNHHLRYIPKPEFSSFEKRHFQITSANNMLLKTHFHLLNDW